MRDEIQFVLASRSPRRAALLSQFGYRFAQRHSGVDETAGADESPRDLVMRLAEAKAAAVVDSQPVLAADTLVVHGGRMLGKPAGREDAVQMLTSLADDWHEVLTAVCLRQDHRTLRCLTVTRVRFAPLDQAAATAYWATGEPADKAGAYAIQGLGGVFVRALEGSYSGVVGLPLAETAAMLSAAGIDAPCWRADAAA